MKAVILSLVAIYMAIGLALSLIVTTDDLKARRISIPGGFGQLSGFHPILFLLYLLLWPAWYFPYRAAVSKGKPPVIAAYGDDQSDYVKKDEPNYRES